MLIQRILFLEGKPDLARREALKVGKTVPEMLAADLTVEYKVVGDLKKATTACEKTQDYVTRDILAVQLEDTEMDHAYSLEKLNDYRYTQSIRVMEEADPLIDRILFMDGLPNVQNLGKLLIGEDVAECLKCDLKYEQDIQRPQLIESIALCEELQDYVSRDLLEDLLQHGEEAIDWMETQHSLITNVTLANYLQAHLAPGGD